MGKFDGVKIPIVVEFENLIKQLEELECKIKNSEPCEHKWKHAATDPCAGVMYLYCEKCGKSKANNIINT